MFRNCIVSFLIGLLYLLVGVFGVDLYVSETGTGSCTSTSDECSWTDADLLIVDSAISNVYIAAGTVTVDTTNKVRLKDGTVNLFGAGPDLTTILWTDVDSDEKAFSQKSKTHLMMRYTFNDLTISVDAPAAFDITYFVLQNGKRYAELEFNNVKFDYVKMFANPMIKFYGQNDSFKATSIVANDLNITNYGSDSSTGGYDSFMFECSYVSMVNMSNITFDNNPGLVVGDYPGIDLGGYFQFYDTLYLNDWYVDNTIIDTNLIYLTSPGDTYVTNHYYGPNTVIGTSNGQSWGDAAMAVTGTGLGSKNIVFDGITLDHITMSYSGSATAFWKFIIDNSGVTITLKNVNVLGGTYNNYLVWIDELEFLTLEDWYIEDLQLSNPILQITDSDANYEMNCVIDGMTVVGSAFSDDFFFGQCAANMQLSGLTMTDTTVSGSFINVDRGTNGLVLSDITLDNVTGTFNLGGGTVGDAIAISNINVINSDLSEENALFVLDCNSSGSTPNYTISGFNVANSALSGLFEVHNCPSMTIEDATLTNSVVYGTVVNLTNSQNSDSYHLNNISFVNNTLDTFTLCQGLITVSGGNTLDISDSNFENNDGSCDYIILVENGGTVNLTNVRFTGCGSTGTCIKVTDGNSHVTLDNVECQECDEGTAIDAPANTTSSSGGGSGDIIYTIPTQEPTTQPTLNPTVNPTVNPTNNPTVDPTVNPTYNPTVDPTYNPTVDPTVNPTNNPTVDPTVNPTVYPSTGPTVSPTPEATESFSSEDSNDKFVTRSDVEFIGMNVITGEVGGNSDKFNPGYRTVFESQFIIHLNTNDSVGYFQTIMNDDDEDDEVTLNIEWNIYKVLRRRNMLSVPHNVTIDPNDILQFVDKELFVNEDGTSGNLTLTNYFVLYNGESISKYNTEICGAFSNEYFESGTEYQFENKVEFSWFYKGIEYFQSTDRTVKLIASDPPKHGDCTVTPVSGSTLVTKFDLSCSNWSVNGSSSSLEYNFIFDETFLKSYDNIDNTQVRLYSNDSSTLTIVKGVIVDTDTMASACVNISIDVSKLTTIGGENIGDLELTDFAAYLLSLINNITSDSTENSVLVTQIGYYLLTDYIESYVIPDGSITDIWAYLISSGAIDLQEQLISTLLTNTDIDVTEAGSIISSLATLTEPLLDADEYGSATVYSNDMINNVLTYAYESVVTALVSSNSSISFDTAQDAIDFLSNTVLLRDLSDESSENGISNGVLTLELIRIISQLLLIDSIPSESYLLMSNSLSLDSSKISTTSIGACGSSSQAIINLSDELLSQRSNNGSSLIDCTVMLTSANLYGVSSNTSFISGSFLNVDLSSDDNDIYAGFSSDYSYLSTCEPIIIQLNVSNSSFWEQATANYPSCSFYNETSQSYESDGCFVLESSEEEDWVQCACVHTTFFGLQASDFALEVNWEPIDWDKPDRTLSNLSSYPLGWIVSLAWIVFCVALIAIISASVHKDDNPLIADENLLFTTDDEEIRVEGMKFRSMQEVALFGHKENEKSCLGKILALWGIAMKNDHIWWGICCRDKGTSFTNAQRIAIMMVRLLTTMAVAALFYGESKGSVIGDFSLAFYESLIGFIPMKFVEDWIKLHKPVSKQRIRNDFEEMFRLRTVHHDKMKLQKQLTNLHLVDGAGHEEDIAIELGWLNTNSTHTTGHMSEGGRVSNKKSGKINKAKKGKKTAAAAATSDFMYDEAELPAEGGGNITRLDSSSHAMGGLDGDGGDGGDGIVQDSQEDNEQEYDGRIERNRGNNKKKPKHVALQSSSNNRNSHGDNTPVVNGTGTNFDNEDDMGFDTSSDDDSIMNITDGGPNTTGGTSGGMTTTGGGLPIPAEGGVTTTGGTSHGGTTTGDGTKKQEKMDDDDDDSQNDNDIVNDNDNDIDINNNNNNELEINEMEMNEEEEEDNMMYVDYNKQETNQSGGEAHPETGGNTLTGGYAEDSEEEEKVAPKKKNKKKARAAAARAEDSDEDDNGDGDGQMTTTGGMPRPRDDGGDDSGGEHDNNAPMTTTGGMQTTGGTTGAHAEDSDSDTSDESENKIDWRDDRRKGNDDVEDEALYDLASPLQRKKIKKAKTKSAKPADYNNYAKPIQAKTINTGNIGSTMVVSSNMTQANTGSTGALLSNKIEASAMIFNSSTYTALSDGATNETGATNATNATNVKGKRARLASDSEVGDGNVTGFETYETAGAATAGGPDENIDDLKRIMLLHHTREKLYEQVYKYPPCCLRFTLCLIVLWAVLAALITSIWCIWFDQTVVALNEYSAVINASDCPSTNYDIPETVWLDWIATNASIAEAMGDEFYYSYSPPEGDSFGTEMTLTQRFLYEVALSYVISVILTQPLILVFKSIFKYISLSNKAQYSIEALWAGDYTGITNDPYHTSTN